MNDFNRCNKVTGIHWLKKPVENISIKVKLKPQDGILSLPKFEDYASETTSVNLKQLENKTDEYTFKWQDKVFSLWELQRYSDIHSCINDTEINYHDMIKDLDFQPSKIFTYIHQDHHLPLPSEKNKKFKNNKFHIQNLNSCLEMLNLNERLGLGENSSSMGHLFRSEENIAMEEEQWTAMHVVFDNSEYNEDSQLILKQEAILLSLYHNTKLNYLIMTPDVNNLELNPYVVEMASRGYQYAIEVEFEETGGGDELVILLQKLHKKWEKKQKQQVNFVMPPLGKTHYCVLFEIVTAENFLTDDLYIEFDIKIPEGVECNDDLHGRTHISKTATGEDCHYGHNIDLNLEVAAGSAPPTILLFFEAISTDWWNRHRTEGYTHLALSPTPGRYSKRLSCSRPEEMDALTAESRRFFVGGCHLIKDLDILSKPQLQDVNFKYTTTGIINCRWSVISAAAPSSAAPPPVGTSSSSAVLLAAEAVLCKYKRASARLKAATQLLTDTRG